MINSDLMLVFSLLLFLVVITFLKTDERNKSNDINNSSSNANNNVYYTHNQRHESPYVKYQHLNDIRKLKSSSNNNHLSQNSHMNYSNNNLNNSNNYNNCNRNSNNMLNSNNRVNINDSLFSDNLYISNTDKKLFDSKWVPLNTPPQNNLRNMSSNNAYMMSDNKQDLFYSANKDINFTETNNKMTQHNYNNYNNTNNACTGNINTNNLNNNKNSALQGNVIYVNLQDRNIFNDKYVTVGAEESPLYYISNSKSNSIDNSNNNQNNDIDKLLSGAVINTETRPFNINNNNYNSNYYKNINNMNTPPFFIDSEMKQDNNNLSEHLKNNDNKEKKQLDEVCFKSLVIENNRRITLSNQVDKGSDKKDLVNNRIKEIEIKDSNTENNFNTNVAITNKKRNRMSDMIKEGLDSYNNNASISKISNIKNNNSLLKASSKLDAMLCTDKNNNNINDDIQGNNRPISLEKQKDQNREVNKILNFNDISISKTNNNKDIDDDIDKSFNLTNTHIKNELFKSFEKDININDSHYKNMETLNASAIKDFLITPPKGSTCKNIDLFDSFGK